MINFDQTAAWNFYNTIHESPDDIGKIETSFQLVVAASGAVSVDRAVKNCQCHREGYNSIDVLANRLWHLLTAMASASSDEVYYYLVPEFFCLGEKAVDLCKTNGKDSSESLDESSAKKPRRS